MVANVVVPLITAASVVMTNQRGHVGIAHFLDVARNAIGWCSRTHNFLRGCSKVSEGCKFCYAIEVGEHQQRIRTKTGEANPYGPLVANGNWTGRVDDAGLGLWMAPFQTRERWLAFTNSVSDPFHATLTDEKVLFFFRVLHLAQWHVWQVLTKRHERLLEFTSRLHFGADGNLYLSKTPLPWEQRAELPNVWLGVSVENQARADERIPCLAQVRAAVRFLSVEPLLGPIDLSPFIDEIDWIIVGGSSAQTFRAMDEAWARAIRDLCINKGTALYFKQRAGIDPSRLPKDLDGVFWHELPKSRRLPLAPDKVRHQLLDWVRADHGRVFGVPSRHILAVNSNNTP